jgi:hypothetical protein
MQEKGYYAKYKTAFFEKNDFDVIFLGSSRAAMHYNTAQFDSLTGANSFNLSASGANSRVSYAIFKAYLENSSAPKHVFFETDLHNLHVNTHDIMEFNNFFPFFKNKTLLEEFNKIDPRMKHFYYNAYYSWPYTGYKNISTSLNGWLGKTTKMDEKMYKGYIKDDFLCTLYFMSTKPCAGGFETTNSNYLDSVIRLCKAKNVHLSLVTSPMFAGGKLDLTNKEQIVNVLDQIAVTNGIKHWNLSSTPYCNQRDLFVNHFHMNHKGARLFTSKLAELYSNNCQKNPLKP